MSCYRPPLHFRRTFGLPIEFIIVGTPQLQPMWEPSLLMKPGTFTHIIAVLLSSVSGVFAPSAPAQPPTAKFKLSKKQNRLNEDVLLKVDPIGYTPPPPFTPPKGEARFPWKKEIVTTVFWIGENPSGNNPVPNHASSWDAAWAKSYGGYDDPNPTRRQD